MLRPVNGLSFFATSTGDDLPPGNSVTIQLRERQVANFLGTFLRKEGIHDARILQEDSNDGKVVVISQAATREALIEALRGFDFTVLET